MGVEYDLDDPAQRLSMEVAVDFFAGAIAGTACAYTGQPLDTVKVKMQTYPSLYRGTISCLMEVVKKEGFRRLYAGAVPAAAANIAENSVLFLCYGQCTKVVAYVAGVNKTKMTSLHKACAGSFASFFAAFALCPLELIKCRMQTLGEYKGSHKSITPYTIIRDIIRVDGISGFYYGMSSTLLREVPGYFFFFGGYEATKAYFQAHDENNMVPKSMKTIAAGGIGGLALWTAIYPFDVIKSRMQVYSQGLHKPTFIEAARELVRKEGFRSFYNGITPTLLRAFPACAALFLAFEWSKTCMVAFAQ